MKQIIVFAFVFVGLLSSPIVFAVNDLPTSQAQVFPSFKETFVLPFEVGKKQWAALHQFVENQLLDLGRSVGSWFRNQGTPKDFITPSPDLMPPSQTPSSPDLLSQELQSLREEIKALKAQGLKPSVIQREPTIIERVVSGLSEEELTLAIQALNNKFLNEIAQLKSLVSSRADANFQAIALTNKIDRLSSVTLNSVTVSGVTGLTDADIPDDITLNSGSNAVFAGNLTVDTDTFFVDATNNRVGIGTTSPLDKLHVQLSSIGLDSTEINAETILIESGDGGIGIYSTEAGSFGSRIVFGEINSGTRALVNKWGIIRTTGTGGDLAFTFGADIDAAANTEIMRLTDGGNVGIGTTNPTSLLELSGSGTQRLAVRNTNESIGQLVTIDFLTGSGSITNTNFIAGLQAKITQASPSALKGDLAFLVNAGDIIFQVMVMEGSTGNIGIGTTSPWRKLSVTGTVGFDGLTTAAGTPDALCLSVSNEVTVNTGVATCTVSSERFKHDIQDFIGGLDTVVNLRPVSFIYNGSTEPRIGLIAEEVNRIEPRLVAIGATGLPRSVRYEELTAVLTKAIQEMQAQIETIKAVSAGWSIANDGTLRVKKLVAQKIETDELKIKSSRGFTIYDEDTKEPLCVKARSGNLVVVPGECGIAPTPQSQPSQPQISVLPALILDTPTSTPDTIITTPETPISTSTPDTPITAPETILDTLSAMPTPILETATTTPNPEPEVSTSTPAIE
ncbi:tail fiber domain-containing protein [Patescibacteria group bacterium]|nr:tail fiber domain-containing protein [Patescibacteria group bacterium]